MKRQALYACLTCVPEAKDDPKKRVGVCLACTYNCHDGHDLIELYTKRNFRCDCGTSVILNVTCKLDTHKLDDNGQNKYNHNFSGTYCICKRPYPDPEDDTPDDMIQCIMCEDWYHMRHLAVAAPDTDDFDEMICQLCTKQHEFLNHYSHLSIMPKNEDNSIASDADVTMNESTSATPNTSAVDCDVNAKCDDVEVKAGDILDDEINQCIRDIIEINKSNQQSESEPCSSTSKAMSADAGSSNMKRKNENSNATANADVPIKKRKCEDGSAVSSSASDVPSTSTNVCRKPKAIFHKFTGASFWLNDWRKELCQCVECMEMYKRGDIEFITDMEDTVQYYTEQGKAKGRPRISAEDMLMSTISNMDHVAKIEAITCYNKLKSKLTDFLATFVSKDQVITETDVKNFFQSNDDKKN